MNLNQLEYFISVAETLNFTRAAERCFITQTAMSQQIRALEKTVGVPLFHRNHHKVELTPAGKVYLNEVKAILGRSEEAIRLARTAAEGMDGTIAIGYIRGYGQRDFTRHLKRFFNVNPGIKMSLMRDNTGPLMNLLETGECDVAFMVAPRSWEKYPQMKHRKLESYPLMAVLPIGHQLADRPVLEYADLSEDRFILMQPSGRPREEMEESLLIYEKGGFMPEVAALYQDPEEILLSVALGMGISLLPEYMIRLHQESQELKILPIVGADGEREMLDLEIVWSGDNNNPVVEHLLKTILP